MRNAFMSPIDTIKRTSLFVRLDEHKYEMKELWQHLRLLEAPEAGLADIVDGKIQKTKIRRVLLLAAGQCVNLRLAIWFVWPLQTLLA